ncbi:MAG: hypothetical protein C0621_00405 [Desulfuromonas sp.]|nr:MAG: hypothetical protein C0621_00405 [Desulfuromonas sp.]
MKVDDFCRKLDEHLTTRASAPERYEVAASALCQAFRLKADEVALFTVDSEADVLRFVWPTKLTGTGTIPLSGKDSLAIRTLTEKKAIVNNRFSNTYHASIFEHIKTCPEGNAPNPIQRIISAPLGQGEEMHGVVQISRRGPSSNEAGNDFTKDELAALTAITTVLSRHI